MRALRVLFGILLLSLVCAGSARASEGFDDLVKMVKNGVQEDIVLAYIDASNTAYNFTVDEILYLNDLGASANVVKAAEVHGKLIRSMAAKAPDAPDATLPPPPNTVDPVVGRPDPIPPPREVVAPAPPDDQPVVVREYVEPAAPVVVAPPPEQLNVSFFYESMSPYGSWVTVGDTYMFRPTVAVADRSWRPYATRGHWVLTDQGWAWQSDYSWGWAAFHYGRWAFDPTYGWVWAPDTVWGPAWVSWRTCDTHYGWAPLPPAARFEAGVGFHFGGKHVSVDFNFGLSERDYFFVPADRFAEPVLTTYAVPQTQVTNIYNNTTVIQNNITYNDNRIINRGPAVEHVRAATKRDIQPVRIADAQVKAGEPIRGNRLSADTMTVYRPTVASAAPETPQAVIARRQAERRAQTFQTNEAKRNATADRNLVKKEDHFQNVEDRKVENKAEAADRERMRLEEAAAREQNQAKRDELKAAAAKARIDAADAKRAAREQAAQADAQRKSAEVQAEAQRKAADTTARQETKRERVDERQTTKAADEEARRRTAAAEAAAREQAKVEPRVVRQPETVSPAATAPKTTTSQSSDTESRKQCEQEAAELRRQEAELRRQEAKDAKKGKQPPPPSTDDNTDPNAPKRR